MSDMLTIITGSSVHVSAHHLQRASRQSPPLNVLPLNQKPEQHLSTLNSTAETQAVNHHSCFCPWSAVHRAMTTIHPQRRVSNAQARTAHTWQYWNTLSHNTGRG
jgi:hypothetical protein